jgi:hypothetical protein
MYQTTRLHIPENHNIDVSAICQSNTPLNAVWPSVVLLFGSVL